MNDSTEALIKGLADKLGTTAEHLFGIMVAHAPISGLMTILVLSAWSAALVVLFKLIQRKTSVPPETENDPHPEAEWKDEPSYLAWLLFATVAFIFAGAATCELPRAVTALVSPEYWALTEIMHQIK